MVSKGEPPTEPGPTDKDDASLRAPEPRRRSRAATTIVKPDPAEPTPALPENGFEATSTTVEPDVASKRGFWPIPFRASRTASRTDTNGYEAAFATETDVAPTVAWTRRLTWEHALYAMLLVAAALSRFWGLGGKALHHDESLHAYYSWAFLEGIDPYTHDPLMHGPFLFHANALIYFLFGASDATSRYMPAIFGVLLVGLPWFLRGPRHLGRWGALAASFLFLVSPALLYQSRYIRHDIYTVVGALALFVAIVRYIERPQRRWLVFASACLSFLYANHEIVFAIALVFVLVLWGALLWGRLRPLFPLHIGAAALGLAVLIAVPRLFPEPFPTIPWGGEGVPAATRDNQFRFYGQLLTWPPVIALTLLVAVFLIVARSILGANRDPNQPRQGVLARALGDAPTGSVDRAILAAWRDKAGLGAAVAVFVGIFVVLYTTLFTNIDGLGTGTLSTRGTLLYWLGQHDVQRGEQPWFYFLVLMPQYEMIAVLFGVAASLITVWRVLAPIRLIRSPRLDLRWDGQTDGRLFFRLFLLAWFGFMFVVLSWAGEKMPWLVVHITLPATLLAASLVGELFERATVPVMATQRRLNFSDNPRFAAWYAPGLGAALVILAGGWFALTGRLTYGSFTRPPDGGAWVRTIPGWALNDWWQIALPPVAAVVLLGFGWFVVGPVRAARVGAFAALTGLVLMQVHAGWRLNYLDGDVPRDMIVYTQSSPDVTRVMAEIDYLSAELTGGKDLNVWYDSGVSWPMQWYLRDFPQKRFFGSAISNPDEFQAVNPPVVLVTNDHLGGVQDQMDGYSAQQYVLRWWFPEDETYRNFAIAPELPAWRSAWENEDNPHGLTAIVGSVADSFETQLTPAGQQRLFRLAMYRDLPAKIGSYDFTMYVRNDLVPLLNSIRY